MKQEDSSQSRLHHLLADLVGSSAVPRRNGELVFDAPWQGRVFGMAVALAEQGLFPWGEFRQALIREVAATGSSATTTPGWLPSSACSPAGVCWPDEIEEVAFQFEFGERDDLV